MKKDLDWKIVLAYPDMQFDCECKDCGNSWDASMNEHFNFSFCNICMGENIGGFMNSEMPSEFTHKEKGVCKLIMFGHVEEYKGDGPGVKLSKDGVEFCCSVHEIEGIDLEAEPKWD